MGRAQHDVHNIRKLRHNCRQGIEHILDTFVGREQPEGEQHGAAFDLKLVFEVGGIDKADIGNAVRDQIDFA